MIAYEKKVGRMCWLVDRDFEMALPFDGPGGEDAWVTLSDGILTVRRGFAWDGLWPLPRLDCGIRASLVHDALYQPSSAVTRSGIGCNALLELMPLYRGTHAN